MIVTLTTDFGSGSSYVAALKGALLAVDPQATVVDLSHDLPPQDLVATAYFLADALPAFPSGCIHIVVVDPGVGTARSLLCIRWRGSLLLVPDNGCWTSLLDANDSPLTAFRLTERQFWRSNVSATFHGRDILAPVAGHLSRGVPPEELGPPVGNWVRLPLPNPVAVGDEVRGEVVQSDRFGNLITNIAERLVPPNGVATAGGRSTQIVRTYGDAEPGTLVALIGSSGRLELAVVNGSAQKALGFGVGAEVVVRPAN